jgi:hypothetical protein
MRVSKSAIGSVSIETLQLPSYQLALVMPGISPRSANWRRQILQSLNFL